MSRSAKLSLAPVTLAARRSASTNTMKIRRYRVGRRAFRLSVIVFRQSVIR